MSDYKYKIGQKVRVREDVKLVTTSAQRHIGKTGIIRVQDHSDSPSAHGNYYRLTEVAGLPTGNLADSMWEFELALVCKLNRDEAR